VTWTAGEIATFSDTVAGGWVVNASLRAELGRLGRRRLVALAGVLDHDRQQNERNPQGAAHRASLEVRVDCGAAEDRCLPETMLPVQVVQFLADVETAGYGARAAADVQRS